MEKRTTLALAIAFAMSVAAPALAQAPAQTTTTTQPTAKTGVQIRVDSVGTSTKTGDAPAVSSQSMTVATARLGVTGELAENISYTLRLNLRSAGNFEAKRNTPDGNLTALDRAIIEHRFAPGFAVKIGRMPIFTGSIESDYSSIDEYMYSYVNGKVLEVSPVSTGVDLSYTFGSHTISLDAFDGFYGTNAETKGPQRGENMSTGIGYRGNIGGMVRPIVSYNQLSRIRNGQGEQRDDKATYTAYAAGAQVSVAGADIDLEYDALKAPEYTSYNVDKKTPTGPLVETTNAKVETNGVIAQVAYNIKPANMRAIVKLTSDKEKTDGDDSYKSQRTLLALEYRPSIKGFRYHAAMVNTNDEAGSDPSTKIKGHQYIVGLAAKM